MPAYVVLEGVEGAGKSTVQAGLASALRADGLEVVEVREPGGTAAGEQIRETVLHPDGVLSPWAESLLFAAGRAQLAAEVIEPALAEGKWVIGDRSVYSSLAYQGAGRWLGVAEVEAVNRAGLGEVWPDLVILLRLDADYGLARQEVQDRIGAELAEFHRRVAAAYDELAATDPDRFCVIDASLPTAEVVAAAVVAVKALS